MFFGVNNFSKALQWINKILNEDYTKDERGLFVACRLLNLIIHFELGNKDLLEHVLKSANYFPFPLEELNKIEITLFNFIKSLQKINEPKELKMEFSRIKEEITPLLKGESGKNAFLYFDYLSWIESKIEKKSFGEIIRNKALLSKK